MWIEKELEQASTINDLVPIRLGLLIYYKSYRYLRAMQSLPICVQFWHWFCDY